MKSLKKHQDQLKTSQKELFYENTEKEQ